MPGRPTTVSEVADPPVPAARIVFDAQQRGEIAARIDAALSSGALTLGANTREFEQAFIDVTGHPFAVAVSSGTSALEIILRSLDVRGREVVVPGNTFAATAFAVLAAGGRPVFADVDRDTFALSPQTVRAVLSGETAAVVLVHIGGLITAEIGALQQLCAERGVALVEDAAHALGSTYGDVPAGGFGVAGGFSFYPTKVITSGEGGMIVTADERLRDEALMYRDQGKAGFLGNQHVRMGSAWRMSELHAAVGLVHLRRLGEFLDVRHRIAARYDEGLRPLDDLTPLVAPAGSRSNYYKYAVRLGDGLDRAVLKARLTDGFGVSLSGEVYETPLHRQPVFEHLARGPLPVAEQICAGHVCLPLHSDMTDAEADRVVAAVTHAVGEQRASRR